MILIDDEEEKKKRLQEAMNITNRINSNSYDFEKDKEDDDLYSKRLEEAMNITNSINPIEYESNFNIDNDDNDINEFNAYYKTLPQEDKETTFAKQENTNKSNNDSLLSKAAYLGKRTLSGIAGGITGIAQAALTDTANKLQNGKEKTRQEVLTNSIKNLINPTQAVIDNIINSQKEMVNIIKDDNKNLIQKVVAIATKSTTDAMDNSFPLAKSINETVGNFIPEVSSQFMNLNEQISKPVEDWKRNLAEEGQNYGTVTNTLGNVGEAVGNMIPSIAATIATKNPNIGLATMGVSAKGQSTQEALSKGAELEEAVRIGNTKGMIEVGTEMLTGGVNIFGKGVLDDILEGVASKVSNNVARFFVKQGLDASGEILEETISDILGTIIDKGTVDPNATYSLKDWGETAIETTLTTFALNILTGGMVKDIQDINRQENKTEEHYDISDIKPFYVLDKSRNDINGVNLVGGLEIDNPNKKVNINPAIVKNTEIDKYNIIDAETGMALDTTPYDNIINAKLGFYHNIINLTDNQITDINRNILNTKMELYNNIESLMQEREIQNETLRNQQNDIIEQNINQNQEINNQNSELAQNGISEKLNLNKKDMQKSENNSSTNNKSFEDVAFDAMSDVDIEETESPLQDRNIETIGKQTNVNAYQYDNPEVKPYFQEMAQMIGEDLSYISSVDNRTSLKGGGTKLNTTTKAISILHDDLGYSYNDISKGLQNIIDDNGKENNAISKKLELIIDDQLRNGYTNALGKGVAPNQEYINTITKDDKGVNINQRNVYQNEINTYKEKSKQQNKINRNINEINTNILDGISKKKQSSFLNEYLKNEVKNHDYFVDGEKIIANSTTIGKLKNGKTNFNKNIDKDIRFELKANIIGNLENIIKTSRIYQRDRVDTKNHTFADTFDRRKSYIQYKGNRYEVMFEVGKKNGRNTLYSIENIKKVGYISSGISPMETSKTPKKVDRTNEPKDSVPQKGNSVKSKTENSTNIQDFGEKIGGARKDTAMPRGTIKTNSKEVIHDYTVKNTENGYSVDFKGKTLQDGFKTQTEAEEYIMAFKDNIKSNLASVEKSHISNEYIIKIRNPRTLKTTYTDIKFSNLQDAESYAMALSIYLKENGKNLARPSIPKIDRINADSKNSTKATGEDILNNFGFKGGEFGNWVTQNERQQFLNYAQDAFTDLATALNVLPSDLGQNGDMNIAFGARGKGLTSAVAHFEPGKKVINMTRLKGAGSLAHEYGHSIDNWLSRLGGDSNGMVTERMYNKKLSENMKSAIKEVEDALNYNITTNQEEVNKKNTIFEENRKKSLLYHLQYLDKVFSGEAKKMKRIKGKYENVPIEVTQQQKNEYQKIRDTLVKGELQGEVDYKANPQTLKTEKTYPQPIDTIQKMYKEVVGRKIDDDTIYWLFRYGKPSKQVTEVKSESAYKKSSVELDRATGRKEAYFSRTDEMWARAFEAYVSDKLKAKGITNTYLVHSVNNGDYALFNPFPAGEERHNINKAFDNLIQTMKDENILHDSKIAMKEESKATKVQGLEKYSRDEIKDIVNNYIQNKLEENDLLDVTIDGSEIIGSRNRGNGKNNSDLDLVVEYLGDIREDDLFNVLNEEPLEIEGIKVDINPITADKSGTLEEYLKKSKQYDKEILNKADNGIRYLKKNSNTVIVESADKIQNELHNRIQNAILSKNSRGRTYLGNVSSETAMQIKKETRNRCYKQKTCISR